MGMWISRIPNRFSLYPSYLGVPGGVTSPENIWGSICDKVVASRLDPPIMYTLRTRRGAPSMFSILWETFSQGWQGREIDSLLCSCSNIEQERWPCSGAFLQNLLCSLICIFELLGQNDRKQYLASFRIIQRQRLLLNIAVAMMSIIFHGVSTPSWGSPLRQFRLRLEF